MEKKYFVEVNGKQKGPYTFDQLSSLRITEQTMVWTSGLDNWVHAKNMSEMATVIVKLPPPLKKRNGIELEPIILATSILIFSCIIVYNRIETYKGVLLIGFCSLILRTYSVYIAVKVSKKRNQEPWTWGLWPFLFPAIVLLIMGFSRPKID